MSLFSALRSSADTLATFQRALDVTQNNVANASTPGYVKQTQTLLAKPFDVDNGVTGGVTAGVVTSARDVYSEAAVRREATALGKWQQETDSLTPLESSFDITGTGGIAGTLSKLYTAFSAWSVAPNNSSTRQEVLAEAGAVASTFNDAAKSVAQTAADTDTQLHGVVNQVNTLAGKLRDYNVQRKGGDTQDAGLEASIYSTLEDLSSLVNITALKQPDGSMTVMLGGQTPLVVGEFQYGIGVDISVPDPTVATYPSGPPSAQILDSSGQVITSQVTAGRLGGLLDVRNNVLASLEGDSSQAGSLNILAKTFADRVNTLLTAGQIDTNGTVDPVTGVTSPTPGVALYSYDATNGTTVAQTLSLTGITSAQLAAIDPGPPSVSNGTALALAGLATPSSAADKLNGQSFVEYYGGIAATAGRAVSTASTNQSLHSDMVAQARELRQQSSGVSLDEEAVHLLEFQRSYQAAAKLVTALDTLTQTVIAMIA
jgi:flagellar hook-associated protein 1